MPILCHQTEGYHTEDLQHLCEKKIGLEWGSTHDLCDTGAELFQLQLSYEANQELVMA